MNFSKFLTKHWWLLLFEFFVFQVEAFQFSKFHENVDKLDKGNFMTGLAMTFNVKISYNYWEKWLKILQACFFVGK